MMAAQPRTKSTFAEVTVRANVLNLENAAVQRILLTAIDTAQGSIDNGAQLRDTLDLHYG